MVLFLPQIRLSLLFKSGFNFSGKQFYFAIRLIMKNHSKKMRNERRRKTSFHWIKINKTMIMMEKWIACTIRLHTLIQSDEWNIAWYDDTDPLRWLLLAARCATYSWCLGISIACAEYISYTNNTFYSSIKRRFINLLYFVCFSILFFSFFFSIFCFLVWFMIIIFSHIALHLFRQLFNPVSSPKRYFVVWSEALWVTEQPIK